MIASLRAFVPSCLCALLFGCAQNNRQPLELFGPRQTTPTTTTQETAGQGSQVYVWIINGGADAPVPGAATQVGGAIASIAGGRSDAAGSRADSVTGQSVQSGVTLNITTGGTTQTPTGSTTGSATGTQTAAQTATQTPTQTVRPEISASVPIGVGMPGSIVDQQATSALRGEAGGEKSSAHQLTWQQLEAAMQDPAVREGILRLLQPPAATSQPSGG